ncbi:hypothetical protein BDF14DRAFT_1808891 [Spinellus fusiger]|nr:hypothetical protein BDF14DRAFT_1808891 [Spinellus fusiger]
MATYGGTSQSGVYTVNVAKAGILDRKYDVAFNGKKASARSWRPVGVALCGSQLFFFADTSSFQSWIDAQTQPKPTPVTRPRNRSLPLPLSPAPSIEPSQSTLTLSSTLSSLDKVGGLLQPYQICSLTDAICIYDESYTKYPHVARFITGDGQQFLLRAENDEALEDWMLKINYAATLKTAHVRPPSWDDAADPREEKVAERRKKEERMAAKIYDYTQSIRDYHASLDQDLQLRRNLMVLIPLQKSTRDRMIALAHVVAKKVRGKRIQLQRLECYREFLEKEMAAHQAQRYLGHFLPPRIMPPFMAKGYSETSFLRTLSARESMETLSIARRESTLQIRSPQDKSFPEVSCPLPLKDGLMMGNEDNSSQRSTLLDDSMSHRRMLSDSTESLLSL